METTTQWDSVHPEPALAAAEPSSWEIVKLTAEYVGWAWTLPQQPHHDIAGADLSFGEQLAEIA